MSIDKQISKVHSVNRDALLAWRNAKLVALHSLNQAHPNEALAREIDWLLREVTGLDRLKWKLGLLEPVVQSNKTIEQLEALWQQHIQDRVPLQYLLGRTTWRNFELKVSPAVLVPRPETELMIDIVAAWVSKHHDSGHWVDLGTGSGAIAIGLAELMPQANIHAVDISEAALAIAKVNAQTLGFTEHIQFWQGSWLEPLQHLKGKVQGICTNPPYIPSEVIATLQPEVQNHEPHLALDGGKDGLHDIRHLVRQAQYYLCEQGILLLECMAGQGEAITALMKQNEYKNIQIHHDLAGFDRFVQGVK